MLQVTNRPVAAKITCYSFVDVTSSFSLVVKVARIAWSMFSDSNCTLPSTCRKWQPPGW